MPESLVVRTDPNWVISNGCSPLRWSRFQGTLLEGRVLAKTGSINRVNTLSGYIEKANGRVITFSIQANAHNVPTRQMLAQIDSVVVQLAR